MKTFLSAALIALSILTATGGPPASAVDVIANDTTDSFEISGALILDTSFSGAEEASRCTNCHWRIIRVCSGGPLEDRRNCLGTPCTSAADIAEIWRADSVELPPIGDASWVYRGLICLQGPPITTQAASSQVRELAIRSIPALNPSSQPAGATLTGLPTIFRSGQPAQPFNASAVVNGVPVQLHASPQWTWDFGHGAPLITADAGAAWPGGRIRHSYPKRGIFRVRVSARWIATYDVRGLTNLPVDGVITQSTWFDLRVREARRFINLSKGV